MVYFVESEIVNLARLAPDIFNKQEVKTRYSTLVNAVKSELGTTCKYCTQGLRSYWSEQIPL